MIVECCYGILWMNFWRPTTHHAFFVYIFSGISLLWLRQCFHVFLKSFYAQFHISSKQLSKYSLSSKRPQGFHMKSCLIPVSLKIQIIISSSHDAKRDETNRKIFRLWWRDNKWRKLINVLLYLVTASQKRREDFSLTMKNMSGKNV